MGGQPRKHSGNVVRKWNSWEGSPSVWSCGFSTPAGLQEDRLLQTSQDEPPPPPRPLSLILSMVSGALK